MLDTLRTAKTTRIPASKRAVKAKPKKAGFRVRIRDTRILLVAPHGKATPPKDDFNTDKITLAIAKRLKCSAIVNDVFKRDGKGGRDFNLGLTTPKHKQFINEIKKIVDADGHTLVVWIHGAKSNSENWKKGVKNNGFKFKPEEVHALIGYGQGSKPLKENDTSLPMPWDNANAFTARTITVDLFRSLLTHYGMTTVLTDDNAPNYRGRHPDNMNQWFFNNRYTFDQVESIQLEICRNDRLKSNIASTVKKIADALAELVPPREEISNAATATTPTDVTESSNEEIA